MVHFVFLLLKHEIRHDEWWSWCFELARACEIMRERAIATHHANIFAHINCSKAASTFGTTEWL